MIQVAIGLAIGLVGGVLSGLLGIGGGLIIVPVLVFLGLTQREASGTSLAALLLPVGLLGFFEYRRRGEVRLDYALAIAVGLTLGALAGAKLAGTISNTNLERLFGGLMLGVGLKFLFFPSG